jgi:maltokinase
VTDQLDGVPGMVASSYAADGRLLAELRAAWPPAPMPTSPDRGYTTPDPADRAPVAALRLSDRFAVALQDEPGGVFLAVPLVRDEILVTSWRRAVPGDGLSAFVAGVPMASERAIEVDQTNTSMVVGERAIVKWYRRVGPEPSRATVLVAHLEATGFAEMPVPLGSLAWERAPGPTLTIAHGDAFLPEARDGWDWCVERLERHVGHGSAPCPAACDPWIGARLGGLVARLHKALATASTILPEPLATADRGTVLDWRTTAEATLDEAIDLTSEQEPEAGNRLGSIVESIRADLAGLPVDRPVRLQPVHGDLHVGQVLECAGGWAVIDFDGNPTLPASGNALRQPVERDIAQLLSSLDHVGRIVAARSGDDAADLIDGWIARNRRDLLDAVDPDPGVLAAFEAEQECRELVYAARFLPRWRYAPLATLRARYGGGRPVSGSPR